MKNEKKPLEGNEPVKVLLADANKDDQQQLKEAIKDGGIKTKLTIANDGDELMKNLKDGKAPNPDIIILDIDMPQTDGKLYVEEIKKDEKTMNIPTVIYTASENEKDVVETFKKGADLYVPKPVFYRNLVLIVRKIFKMLKQGLLLRPLRKNYVLKEEEIQATSKPEH